MAMRNGYALATREGLSEIAAHIQSLEEQDLEALRGELRVGVQWNTQVTRPGADHDVTQVYCSALPVAYSNHGAAHWATFAKFVLDASYEATFCLAVLNAMKTQNNTVFVTMLGGGAFGNRNEWIVEAIARSIGLFKNFDLNVRIVSYGRPSDEVQKLIDLV
jgi:hypothetical protein